MSTPAGPCFTGKLIEACGAASSAGQASAPNDIKLPSGPAPQYIACWTGDPLAPALTPLSKLTSREREREGERGKSCEHAHLWPRLIDASEARFWLGEQSGAFRTCTPQRQTCVSYTLAKLENLHELPSTCTKLST